MSVIVPNPRGSISEESTYTSKDLKHFLREVHERYEASCVIDSRGDVAHEKSVYSCACEVRDEWGCDYELVKLAEIVLHNRCSVREAVIGWARR